MDKTRLRAIGIASSPRRNGNSTTLLRELLDGASSVGAETSVVYLNDIIYKGCQSCENCPPDDCRVKDELSAVIHTLASADIWALATPIYFDGASGQLKLFFDRCNWLMKGADGGKTYRPKLAGSRAAAFIVTYEMNENPAYQRVPEILAGYMSWIGDFGTPAIICEPQMKDRTDASKNPERLANARAIGTQLVADVLSRRAV